MNYEEFKNKLTDLKFISLSESHDANGSTVLTIMLKADHSQERYLSRVILEVSPNIPSLIIKSDFNVVEGISLHAFCQLLNIVAEFQDTPVEMRWPEDDPKYYVLDCDLGHITDVSLTPSSLTVHYATNAEKQDINPALLFTLLCSEYVAVTNVFKSTSITRVTNKTKVTYDPEDTEDSQKLISQLIKDTRDDDNESLD